MNKEAPDCLVDIWVTGNKAHIDRNFNPIIEGQRSHVILRFHFLEGWDERPTRMVTVINAARVYTSELRNGKLQMPIFMLKEGTLRFIVRGFKLAPNPMTGVVGKNTHDVKPMSEDDNGYIEVNNMDDPIHITGGSNGYMLRL